MPSQINLDKTYLEMARVWSQLSKANRQKVGCIIVKEGSIISDGYNGTPIGFDNTCETSIMPESTSPKSLSDHPPNALITKPEVLHAESNAITKLAKSTQSSKDSTMYITISPCIECAKLIIQSGISRVVYGNNYRNLDGVNLLLKANIEVECYENKI
jgi:dCMP deaminase